MIIAKGQKVDVTKGRSLTEIGIGLVWETKRSGIDINASAFLLNADGRCAQDQDMIFYNQPISRKHAVFHSTGLDGDRERIEINIRQLPDDIARIAVTLTIHDGETNGQTFSDVGMASCRIFNSVDRTEIGRFHFGESLQQETAIVVGEFYLNKGDWKFNAVGSGFNGGLPALVTHFGLELSEPAGQEIAAATEIVLAPPMIPVPAAPIQAAKVELKKKESINIQKSQKVTATLEWVTKKDLDLYCFYVTKENEVGKIYYRNLGSAKKKPYIQLDGDAMSHGKETIIIHRPEALRFVLFAAYSALSNGTGSFKSMKVRAIVDNHQGQVVTTPLHEKNHYAYWVAIAHIDFTGNHQMRVSHVETYSDDGEERSPLLYVDGTFKMDVGPEEFK